MHVQFIRFYFYIFFNMITLSNIQTKYKYFINEVQNTYIIIAYYKWIEKLYIKKTHIGDELLHNLNMQETTILN